jgi:hypothetical protein
MKIFSVLLVVFGLSCRLNADQASDFQKLWLAGGCDQVAMGDLAASGCIDWTGFSGCTEATVADYIARGCLAMQEMRATPPMSECSKAKVNNYII